MMRKATAVLYRQLIPLSLLICSCVGLPLEDEMPEMPRDYSIQRIDKMLNDGQYLEALPLILSRERDGHDEQLRREMIRQSLQTQWDEARSTQNWKSSIRYLQSFALLEDEFNTGTTSMNDLYLEGAMEYIDKNQLGAASALLQANVDFSELDQAMRNRLVDIFAEKNFPHLLADLREEERPRAAQMPSVIDGTVTVWVNKGIRLEGNVGIPDRVIGSGFFIDPEGYLLTNYHVIESEVDPAYKGYSRLFIKIDDESAERFPAKVVGWDKNFDLALLKTEMDVPYVFGFAQGEFPQLGEQIAAIGSPGGLTRTLTTGTVSAYARSIQPMAGSLQIDVPINPGNSGGPLLNGKGEVIGVVFAGIEDYEGINFAIPGPYVLRLLPSLYTKGALEHSWLGVSAWDKSGELRLTYVVPNSPAADAGLLPDDVIREVNGMAFTNIQNLQAYLLTRSAGTLISLSLERKGEVIQTLATLGPRPEIPMRSALKRDARINLLKPLFGFTVERVSGSGLYQRYRVQSLIRGSVADEAGFSADDTIALRRWEYVEEYEIVLIQLILKGRKAGFLETPIQLVAFLNVNTAL